MVVMLTLYNTPHSTCSQKVRFCLTEKKLDWIDVNINLANTEHLTLEYLKINENGVAPTLVNDKNVIKDSSVICEYIDEIFRGSANVQSLTPEDLIKRAEMRSWVRFIEEVPTPAVRVPSFNMAFVSRFKGFSRDKFHDQQSDIRPLRKEFYRRMGPNGFDCEDFKSAVEKIYTTTNRMELLPQKGPWLIGRSYSIADIILAPLLNRMDDLGFTKIWGYDCPCVVDWIKHIRVRPAFQAFCKGTRLSELHNL
jgi:glutathione S-transferase